MSNVTVKLDKNIIKRLKAFGLSTDRAIDDAVLVTATNVQKTAINSIRTQSKGKKVGKHVVSKEGDAPNTDTGTLVQHIKVLHVKGTKVAHVGTDLEYGKFLETVHNRPWLVPAKDKEIQSFPKVLENVMKKHIEKASE